MQMVFFALTMNRIESFKFECHVCAHQAASFLNVDPQLNAHSSQQVYLLSLLVMITADVTVTVREGG